MQLFPGVDPIPLPAPVWLFKLLHHVTLSTHLIAVHLLLGGLALGTVWAFAGFRRQDAILQQAAGLTAHRLPIVMAYVINLGVPPLLFAQVLYGRALYTSSVLIGAFWISVIFLIMGSYYALYAAAKRAEQQRGWSSISLISLLLALFVAYLYTQNMTLMLRPEAWQEMYQADAAGAQLHHGPTVLARWLFMLAGSVAVAAVGLVLLSQKQTVEMPVRGFLRRHGGTLAAVAIAVQAGLGAWTLRLQESAVRTGLGQNPLYNGARWTWLLTAVLLVGAALYARGDAERRSWPRVVPLVSLAVVNVGAMVLVRDGVRDLMLAARGFDVWDRTIATNWSVVGFFLLLFVAGLGAVGWMITVVARARAVEERYA